MKSNAGPTGRVVEEYKDGRRVEEKIKMSVVM